METRVEHEMDTEHLYEHLGLRFLARGLNPKP